MKEEMIKELEEAGRIPEGFFKRKGAEEAFLAHYLAEVAAWRKGIPGFSRKCAKCGGEELLMEYSRRKMPKSCLGIYEVLTPESEWRILSGIDPEIRTDCIRATCSRCKHQWEQLPADDVTEAERLRREAEREERRRDRELAREHYAKAALDRAEARAEYQKYLRRRNIKVWLLFGLFAAAVVALALSPYLFPEAIEVLARWAARP